MKFHNQIHTKFITPEMTELSRVFGYINGIILVKQQE